MKKRTDVHSMSRKELEDLVSEMRKALARREDEAVRARTEEAVEQQMHQAIALEAAGMVTWEWHIPTSSIRYSKNISDIVRGKEVDPYQSLDTLLPEIHPEDRGRLARSLDNTKKTGMPWECEYRAHMLDGTYRWILGRGGHVILKDGKPVRVLGISMDITERKRAEEILHQRAEELAAANSDLESFSYSVSHDLRNPLWQIGGYAGFLREACAGGLGEKGREYLRRVLDGVHKMHRIIDDMLHLSQIGRQDVNLKNVCLSAMVRDYLRELGDAEPRRRADFIIQKNVRARVDPRLMHLALENLLRNAWKFTSGKKTARIAFGARNVGGRTVYFVRDNGEGFRMRFAEKIFEPFKRAHANRGFEGTGVGLAIVRRVIGRHGGRVWAEGKAGKGSVFYFTLGEKQ